MVVAAVGSVHTRKVGVLQWTSHGVHEMAAAAVAVVVAAAAGRGWHGEEEELMMIWALQVLPLFF